MAEQSSGFPQLRDCLSAAGTSLSVTEMKLLYADGCLAARIPDSRGPFSIGVYSRTSPGLLQNLGSGRVLCGICVTCSQDGSLDYLDLVSCALGNTCISISWYINVRKTVCFDFDIVTTGPQGAAAGLATSLPVI